MSKEHKTTLNMVSDFKELLDTLAKKKRSPKGQKELNYAIGASLGILLTWEKYMR